MSLPSRVFNVEVARRYGVEVAVIVDVLQRWVGYEEVRRRGATDESGPTWVEIPPSLWKETFPFWGARYLTALVDALVEQEILVRENDYFAFGPRGQELAP